MGALGISISQLLTQVISFLILFFLLYKLAYGPLIKMLDSRSDKIKESLDWLINQVEDLFFKSNQNFIHEKFK